MASCALAEKPEQQVLPRCETDLPDSPSHSPEKAGPPSPSLWDDLEKHCVHPEFDLRLAARFTQLVTLQSVCSTATSALPRNGGSSTTAARNAVKVILRCLRLLHLCGYSTESIEVIAAYAAVYLEDCIAELGDDIAGNMEIQELASILCVWMFLAHSYVEDTACRLKIWHKLVFFDYCPLATLNTVALRLMEMRGFVLRVDDDAFNDRLAFLKGSGE